MREKNATIETQKTERAPWSVLVLVQNVSLASPLLRMLSAYRNGRETFDIQYVDTPEEQRWALHHLRTQQMFPHLVIFDAFNVAMQHGFLLALREFPEIGKVLIGEDVQMEVVKLAIDTCGVDVVAEAPFVPRQMFQLLDRLRTHWAIDGTQPLRLMAESAAHQIRALEAQNNALARANARTVDAIADMDRRSSVFSQKESTYQQIIQVLAVDNLSAGGMLVQGSLTECSLLQLLRILSMASLSVKVVLLQGNQQASVSMWEGQLLHAGGNGAVGSHALEQLLGWEWGEYFVQTIEAPSERTIFSDTDELLYEQQVNSHQTPLPLMS